MSTDADKQFEPLTDLSNQLSADLFNATIGANQIVKTSFPEVFSRTPFTLLPHYYQLGKLTFDWKLFLERRSSQVFFGFRRKNKFDNLLRTQLSFKLSPVEDLSKISTSQKINFEWAPPSFIELSPPENLVRHVLNDNDNNRRENILWIKDTKIPDALFAICFNKPKRFARSDIFYFKNENPTGVKPVFAKKAPIDWYERILISILPWINGEYGNPVKINLAGTDRSIKQILDALSKTFVVSNKEIVKKQRSRQDIQTTPAGILMPDYFLSEYKASVVLRLDKEEQLSTVLFTPPREIDEQAKGLFDDSTEDLFDEDDAEMTPKGLDDEKELFQIGVNLEGIRQEDEARIKFNIYPPDSLTEGPMFDAFLESFLKIVRRTDKIAKHLNEKQELLESILANPLPGSFIFRIGKKGNLDIEVFVLRVKNNGEERFIMFRANFIVKPETNTVIFKKKIKNLIEILAPGELELERQGVLYTMRLLWQVNSWKNRVL